MLFRFEETGIVITHSNLSADIRTADSIQSVQETCTAMDATRSFARLAMARIRQSGSVKIRSSQYLDFADSEPAELWP